MTRNARQSKQSSRDHYQVKFPDTDRGTFYGIARTSACDKDVQREAARGRVIVDHAVFPGFTTVAEDWLIDIPLDFGRPEYDANIGLYWGGDEYHRYVALQELLHDVRHDHLPDDRLSVGHLFREPVGDGSATYCVTRVRRKLCTVEWRGFCLDRWAARPWGWCGEFRRRDVEPLVISEGRLGRVLAARRNALRNKREQAAARFLPEFERQYGLPDDVRELAAELDLPVT